MIHGTVLLEILSLFGRFNSLLSSIVKEDLAAAVIVVALEEILSNRHSNWDKIFEVDSPVFSFKLALYNLLVKIFSSVLFLYKINKTKIRLLTEFI